MFEDTKVVFRSRKQEGQTIQWPKEKWTKKEQWSTTHYTEK